MMTLTKCWKFFRPFLVRLVDHSALAVGTLQLLLWKKTILMKITMLLYNVFWMVEYLFKSGYQKNTKHSVKLFIGESHHGKCL